MQKAKKIISVIIKNIICLIDGIDNRLFTQIYKRYLEHLGVIFRGEPNYISSSAYFDGQGYSLIEIGKDVVISREVMLLTHDYSIETALHSIGRGTRLRINKVDGRIIIGTNTFIGARSSILPGTIIGENCIIGACSVVKGAIPSNSVVIGNPCTIIKTTDSLARTALANRHIQAD